MKKIGRPKINKDERRIAITTRVHPDTIKFFKKIKAPIGRIIDELVEKYQGEK